LDQVIGLEAGQPEYRVLIVDDERENWMVLKRMLETTGFHVRIAEDGSRGIQIFQDWRPHFIWMDVLMPVMNGFEVAGRIRALEGGRDVKIAAVTASGLSNHQGEALAAGMDEYVRKPYRPSEIFECMSRQLGVRYRRKAAPVAENPMPVLRPEALAALPQELREALREALLALDVERVSVAIQRTSGENDEIGSALACYARRYAYTAILNAIDPELTQSAEATI
jgi:CheY-like chemotaxis protein